MFENQSNILCPQKPFLESFKKVNSNTAISTSIQMDSLIKSGNLIDIRKILETTKLDPISAESLLYKIIKSKEIPVEKQIIEKLLS